MAGGSVRASAGPPSQRSAQGEPRPVARGPSGSTCAAHNHTRARAHARARPRCTLQHTNPLHCTCTTHAHFCSCTLTCPPRSGASGRGGRCWARHGWAPPIFGHREPPRGLQPPQHHAAGRFAAAVQHDGWGVSGQRWSIRQLVYALMAADAGAQIASRRERGVRASGIKGSCMCLLVEVV